VPALVPMDCGSSRLSTMTQPNFGSRKLMLSPRTASARTRCLPEVARLYWLGADTSGAVSRKLCAPYPMSFANAPKRTSSPGGGTGARPSPFVRICSCCAALTSPANSSRRFHAMRRTKLSLYETNALKVPSQPRYVAHVALSRCVSCAERYGPVDCPTFVCSNAKDARYPIPRKVAQEEGATPICFASFVNRRKNAADWRL
jgi:hypothetical protein